MKDEIFEEAENADGFFHSYPVGVEEKETESIRPARKMKYQTAHILAFAAPFILMLTAFYTVEIFPFGDKQIMVVDSWHQYYPFLQELHHKLTNFESLL